MTSLLQLPLAVAFSPAPLGDSPNIRSRPHQDPEAAYAPAIRCTFASLRRFHPDNPLLYITNTDPSPTILNILRDVEAKLVVIDYNSSPPAGFAPNFSSCLFSIDALRWLNENTTDGSFAYLIDPDVLCVRAFANEYAESAPFAWSAYNTGLAPDSVNQGVTARQAGVIHNLLDADLPLDKIPLHYGGEFYAFRCGRSSDEVLKRALDAYADSKMRFMAGQVYLRTEEHMLNYALRTIDVRPANAYIKRIWTAPSHRTTAAEDLALSLWHLPAEKSRGFRKVADDAADLTSWFWQASATEYRARAALELGVGNRRQYRRAIFDTFASSARRMEAIAKYTLKN